MPAMQAGCSNEEPVFRVLNLVGCVFFLTFCLDKANRYFNYKLIHF